MSNSVSHTNIKLNAQPPTLYAMGANPNFKMGKKLYMANGTRNKRKFNTATTSQGSSSRLGSSQAPIIAGTGFASLIRSIIGGKSRRSKKTMKRKSRSRR